MKPIVLALAFLLGLVVNVSIRNVAADTGDKIVNALERIARAMENGKCR